MANQPTTDQPAADSKSDKAVKGLGTFDTSVLTVGALAAGFALNAFLSTQPGVSLELAQISGLATQMFLMLPIGSAARKDGSWALTPPMLGMLVAVLSMPFYSTFPIPGGLWGVISEGAPLAVPIILALAAVRFFGRRRGGPGPS